MKKRIGFFPVAVLLILGSASPSFAASGASFLKLGVGARALGLGSAYTAVTDDVTALHWNPAGLSRLKTKELSAMHAELFADTRFDFIGYAQPGKRWSFGAGAVYLTQGLIEGRGESREETPSFTASDIAVTLGGGMKLGDRTGLGLNVKVLQSKIAGISSTGFAFDIGATLTPALSKPDKSGNYKSSRNAPLTLGFAVQNLGPKMKFIEEGDNLPLTLAGGAAYPLFSRMLISADLRHQPYDSRTSFSVGTEFSPLSLISLRAGYLASSTTRAAAGIRKQPAGVENLSRISGLGLGLGLKLGPGSIDYSFTPAGELGNTQRISLSIKF